MHAVRTSFKTRALRVAALALGFPLLGCGSSPQKSPTEYSKRNAVTESFEEEIRRHNERVRSEHAETERIHSERERILELRERQKKAGRIAELLRSIKKGGSR